MVEQQMSNKYKKVLGGLVKEAKQGWLERGRENVTNTLKGFGYQAGDIIKDNVSAGIDEGFTKFLKKYNINPNNIDSELAKRIYGIYQQSIGPIQNDLSRRLDSQMKDISAKVQAQGVNVLNHWGQHADKNIVPKLIQRGFKEFNNHLDTNKAAYSQYASDMGTAAAKGATDEVKKRLPAMSQDAGNNFMSGALNNKQLHSWLSRGGGAIAGALLLSSFIKNKPLALLLGGLGGGYLGDYIHKNWKGDWGKTWDGMKKEWGWK